MITIIGRCVNGLKFKVTQVFQMFAVGVEDTQYITDLEFVVEDYSTGTWKF